MKQEKEIYIIMEELDITIEKDEKTCCSDLKTVGEVSL